FNETRSRTYRGAAGVNWQFSDDWNLSVDAVGMRTDLTRISDGYVYIQNLLNVIADGSYNFVNPYMNSQDTLDYLSPDNVTESSSELYGIQAVVAGPVLDLPGGPLEIGVGAAIRYEAINAPSANSDANGPTQRYFVLNAFGTSGDRTVTSAYAEIK